MAYACAVVLDGTFFVGKWVGLVSITLKLSRKRHPTPKSMEMRVSKARNVGEHTHF